MADLIIRNKNNTPIGKCQDFSNKINAMHYRHGYCGYYNKSMDITFTKTGRIYAYGDATQCLIRDAEAGRNSDNI